MSIIQVEGQNEIRQTMASSSDQQEILRVGMLQYQKTLDLQIKHKEATFAQQHATVRSWLGDDSTTTRHEDIAKRRHPDTGEWIFENPKFKRWYDPEHCKDPLLWIHGLPGAGMFSQARMRSRHYRKLMYLAPPSNSYCMCRY